MPQITVAALQENLDTVTDFINQQLERADCSMKVMNQVNLAVEEIYVNIALYAYQPEIGNVTIRCEVNGDPAQITVCFTDSGKPYNPLRKADPDVTAAAEERAVGGLGVFLVKKLMDDVHYEYLNGQNSLTLQKRL